MLIKIERYNLKKTEVRPCYLNTDYIVYIDILNGGTIGDYLQVEVYGNVDDGASGYTINIPMKYQVLFDKICASGLIKLG